MAPLEQLERQAKDTVKGQVRAAQAQVQRQTSIVRLAGAGLKPRLGRRAGRRATPRPEPRPGVYAQSTLAG